MTFSNSDIDLLDGLLRRAGSKEIVPRFLRINDGEVKQKKAAWDVVTEADTAAEAFLTAALLERYPQAKIVGEEAAADDPAILEGLADAELAFVIDPVDGTFNFASGMPLFGTILAVIVNGACVAGLVHYPMSGESMIGIAGGGSRIVDGTGKTQAIRVAAPVTLDQMVGTISWGFMEEPGRSRVAANLAKIGMAFGFRCSAWEYRLAATGKVHFVGGQNMMPWDHLAGVLIHQEAGGHSALIDGRAYRPGMMQGGLLSAPDQESWTRIRDEIINA